MPATGQKKKKKKDGKGNLLLTNQKADQINQECECLCATIH